MTSPYILAEINALLLQLLVTEEKIDSWLQNKNIAFHGLTPLEMLRMSRGEYVIDVLKNQLRDREIFKG